MVDGRLSCSARNDGVLGPGRGRKLAGVIAAKDDRGAAGLRPDQPIGEAVRERLISGKIDGGHRDRRAENEPTERERIGRGDAPVCQNRTKKLRATRDNHLRQPPGSGGIPSRTCAETASRGFVSTATDRWAELFQQLANPHEIISNEPKEDCRRRRVVGGSRRSATGSSQLLPRCCGRKHRAEGDWQLSGIPSEKPPFAFRPVAAIQSRKRESG